MYQDLPYLYWENSPLKENLVPLSTNSDLDTPHDRDQLLKCKFLCYPFLLWVSHETLFKRLAWVKFYFKISLVDSIYSASSWKPHQTERKGFLNCKIPQKKKTKQKTSITKITKVEGCMVIDSAVEYPSQIHESLRNWRQ